jgi:glycosyltransferase involved in cell wall biosynthesis
MVSIIIPCYNKAQFITECVESVHANTFEEEVEVIVIDDCSTDDSFGTIQNLNKVVYSTNDKNEGRSYTRNRGVKKSKGEYIICLDADDMIAPNYIQECYNTITQENVDICYNDSYMFGDQVQRITWPEFDLERLKKGPYIHCAAMYKRKVFDTIGGYDESMKLGWEDYDFWLSAGKKGFKFKKNNNTYLAYRQYFGSLTNTDGTNTKLVQDKIKTYLKEKHGEFFIW